MAPNFLCEQANACLEGKKPAQYFLDCISCIRFVPSYQRRLVSAKKGSVLACFKLLKVLKCISLCHRKPECDIRIQLPNVSLEHAVVRVDNDRKVSYKASAKL